MPQFAVRSVFSTFILFLFLTAAPRATSQTFFVLHTFTGAADGDQPTAGLTLNNAGNLYGTTTLGGYSGGLCSGGCGTVFRLKRSGQGWVLDSLYAFNGAFSDGAAPESRAVLGPSGALYGTTVSGGVAALGTVYRLTPQASFCRSVLCRWSESVFSFPAGERNGADPSGNLSFDATGNAYGTTIEGGLQDCGVIYEATLSGGVWLENVLYQFGSGSSCRPVSGVTFDASGNLFGTTQQGGMAGKGTIYELTPNGGSWSQTILYDFAGQNDGSSPQAGLVRDGIGNFYGAAPWTAPGGGGGGTVFEFSPAGDTWVYTVIYSFGGSNVGPLTNLSMDASGNLYGTTFSDGAFGQGNVFRLTPSGGGWSYTDLYDFTGGSDGGYPISSVAIDDAGNLYGTTEYGGTVNANCSQGCGVVWEITP